MRFKTRMTSAVALALASVFLIVGCSAVTPSPSPSAQSVTAPVTLVPDQWGYTPTVRISIAGSDPITVMLDSGSSGLVMNGAVLPSSVTSKLTDLKATLVETYSSSTVKGELFSGDVGLVGANGASSGTWTTSMVIGICQTPTPSCVWSRGGVQGVLGIGNGAQTWTATAPATGSGVLASPFTSTTGAMGSGVSFHLSSASNTGTFTVGTPAAIAGGTVLQAPTNGLKYANGATSYFHYVSGCWSIKQVTSCDAFTTYDTGEPRGFISTYQFESLFPSQTKVVPVGTEIGFSAGTGKPAFGTITTSNPMYSVIYSPGLRKDPIINNSGCGFLLDRDVAISYTTGTVTIGPSSTH